MGTAAVSDREDFTAALDRFEAAQAEVAALSFDVLTAPEVLTVKDRLDTVHRRQAAVDHRLTHHLTSQASLVDLGGKSWTDVLSNRLQRLPGFVVIRLAPAAPTNPPHTPLCALGRHVHVNCALARAAQDLGVHGAGK